MFINGQGGTRHFRYDVKVIPGIDHLRDEGAPSRVPGDVFLYAEHLASLGQCLRKACGELFHAGCLFGRGGVLVGKDGKHVVPVSRAFVLVHDVPGLLQQDGLGSLRELDALVHDTVFLNQVPGEVADIHVGHAARVIAEQEQVEVQLFLPGKQGAVYVGDFLDDLVQNGSGGCFRSLDIIAQAKESVHVYPVHFLFPCMVTNGAQQAQLVRQPGFIAVPDTLFLDPKREIQQEQPGDVGEEIGGKETVVLLFREPLQGHTINTRNV